MFVETRQGNALSLHHALSLPYLYIFTGHPSLKWGLVSFFAGIGFLIIDQMSPALSNNNGNYWNRNHNNFMEHSLLPFGIELVSISLGFIVYFLIENFSRRK